MRFVIVGPGALGSVIGATLTRRGHDVTLLGRRSPHLQTLREQGLRLEAPDGTNNRVAIAATDDPAVVSQAETVIVLVKAGDTVPAMATIRPYIRADQTILTLQNGIGNAEKIRSALGAGPRVLVGVTSQAATRLGPGAVRHAGEGPTLIGVLDKRDSSAAAELAGIFTQSGLPSAFVPDIEHWIWRKLAINAAINGLTALGGFENGMIASDTSLLDAAEVIAEEVARVARGRGIELGGMRRAILDTAVATASNRSSMLQDLEARRPTEVDAIHGAVLAAGEETGIATPATQVIAALIRAKETTLVTLEHAVASEDHPESLDTKLTAYDIQARKGGLRLSMVSVYDFPFARLAEEAGIDILLVGDSLGMVVQGHDSTVPVTLDDIVYHAKAVRRGAPRTHVVADLPFLTYHTDTGRAIENAGRLLQEGGADSVKLEGGQQIAERAAAIVRAGIPVMGHIGLTPQSAGALGGFKVQGRNVASARKILDDARAIADAGAYAMVVEVIPAELGEMITASVPIPTIGIGAGAACDGQVLVGHDMLGLQERIIGRFAKVYANVGDDVRRAFTAFAEEVRAGAFPDEEHSYAMAKDVIAQLRESSR